ncbi:hypothetical protein [Jiangella alba]|uniref:Nucleotidyltransferase domain-containing protein n=1 Tax=Jiangella alba TaxID=561176 RepID=A0A1H5PRG6_9ACTN|nr:hypothetical protein [Jiangella alba]SEF15721.1 hypothetical protein SAMN04488561_5054 [Jiangella alba]
MTTDTAGPWEIVDALTSWARRTPWCDWVELAGSLGRGAGDELSDVDAGLGVLLDGATYDDRRDAALAAARGYAVVAGELIQHLGSPERPADHLVLQYADGRQLSLVVMAADSRPGLAAGSQAVFDRSGRLAAPFAPPALNAGHEQRREWAFLGWWGLADVAKHAGRGRVWRAIESLHEVRTYVWQLHGAELGVDYPGFGAVSVQNADLPEPAGLAATLPSAAEPAAVLAAARALGHVLEPLAAPHAVDGVRAEALRRLGPATP